jgi:hypothetical protein
MNNFTRKPINQVGSSDEGFILEFERHGCMSKQG